MQLDVPIQAILPDSLSVSPIFYIQYKGITDFCISVGFDLTSRTVERLVALLFWELLPDVLNGMSVVCMALTLVHVISMYFDRGLWLGKFLDRAAGVFEKWTAWIHEVFDFAKDITKASPLYTGFGCLALLSFVYMFIVITRMIAGGKLRLLMWNIEEILNWSFRKIGNELSGLAPLFLFPLIFVLLAALIWVLLALVSKVVRAYATNWSGTSTILRQSIFIGLWFVLGFGGFLSSKHARPYADSKVEAILSTRLESGNLRGTDLRNMNLSGIDLSRADLSGADLRGACLIGAKLRKAYIENALMAGACLDEANLYDARLFEVNLKSASLKDAILDSASFEDVNFSGADLQGASTKLTVIRSGTKLPDGSKGESFEKIDRFTDPEHPDFWDADSSILPASCEKSIDY